MLAMFQTSGQPKPAHAKHGHAKPATRKSLRTDMLTIIPTLIIGARRSRGGVSLHVRPQAHVVAGDGAVGHLRRRIGMLVAVLASFLYAFDVGAAAKPHLMVNIGLAVVALAIWAAGSPGGAARKWR
jgi:hypothetical protein